MSRDRRTQNRNSCYMRAEIHYPGLKEPIPAEAHDISDNGFRIGVLNAAKVPNEFTLVIPRRKIKENVKVVRRGEHELGLVINQPFNLALGVRSA